MFLLVQISCPKLVKILKEHSSWKQKGAHPDIYCNLCDLEYHQ
jgi:hypothetical protein